MDKTANIKRMLISRLARSADTGSKTRVVGRRVMPDERKQKLLRMMPSPKEKARIMGMEGGKTKSIRRDSMSPKTIADRRAALEAKPSPRDKALGREGERTKNMKILDVDSMASRMAKDRQRVSAFAKGEKAHRASVAKFKKRMKRDGALDRVGSVTKSIQVNDAVASRMARNRRFLANRANLRKGPPKGRAQTPAAQVSAPGEANTAQRLRAGAKATPAKSAPAQVSAPAKAAPGAPPKGRAAVPPTRISAPGEANTAQRLRAGAKASRLRRGAQAAPAEAVTKVRPAADMPPPVPARKPTAKPKTKVNVDNTPVTGATTAATAARSRRKVVPISNHPRFKRKAPAPSPTSGTKSTALNVKRKAKAPVQMTPAGTKVDSPTAYLAAAKAKKGKGVTKVDKSPNFTPSGTKVDSGGTRVLKGTQVDRQAAQGPVAPSRKQLEQAGKERDKDKVVQMAKWLAPAAVGGGAATAAGYGAS